MKTLQSILVLLFFALVSCSKSDDTPASQDPSGTNPTGTNPTGKNVYIAGTTTTNELATIWKNGVATVMPVAAGAASQIVSLVVEGNDVYLLTNEYDPVSFGSDIVLYKNNTKINLGQGTANKLIVKNGNYYILGAYGYSNGFLDGFYFINGTKVTLFTNKAFDYVSDMYVKDGNVYISGHKKFTQNGKKTAVLWTNTANNQTLLSDGAKDAKAANIEFINNEINVLVYESTEIVNVSASYYLKKWKNNQLSGINMPAGLFFGSFLKIDSENNIHIIGVFDNGNPDVSYVYLKNDTEVPIIASNQFSKECLDMAIKGSDVYIAGSQKFSNINAPVIWKNGVANVLPNTSPDEVKSICLFNEDVYAVGKNSDSFWINSQKQPQLAGENPKFKKIVVTN